MSFRVVEGKCYSAVQVHGKDCYSIFRSIVCNYWDFHDLSRPAFLGKGGHCRPGGVSRQVAIADDLHIVRAA